MTWHFENLILYMDSLTHFHSQKVNFYLHGSNSAKVTALVIITQLQG